VQLYIAVQDLDRKKKKLHQVRNVMIYSIINAKKKHTEKEKLKKKSLAAPPSLIPKRGHPHHHITLNCMW
jgi:DNA-binding protein H-NS